MAIRLVDCWRCGSLRNHHYLPGGRSLRRRSTLLAYAGGLASRPDIRAEFSALASDRRAAADVDDLTDRMCGRRPRAPRAHIAARAAALWPSDPRLWDPVLADELVAGGPSPIESPPRVPCVVFQADPARAALDSEHAEALAKPLRRWSVWLLVRVRHTWCARRTWRQWSRHSVA